MDTRDRRTDRLCNGLIEAGWLVALAVTPLVFNPFSNRSFEPEKTAVLRVLVVMMVGFWLVKAAFRIGSGRHAQRAWRMSADSLPIVAIVVTAFVSSVLSVDPRLSVFGSYLRGQGLLNLLVLAVFFWLVAGHLRRTEQWNRVVFVVVISGVSVSLYALMQWAGTDPLAWSGSTSRPSSTLGNPIFLSGFLLMTIFMTFRGLLDSIGRLFRPAANGGTTRRSHGAVVLRTGFFIFAFACQAMAFIRSESRGPLLGLVAGATVWFLLFALQLRGAADSRTRWSIRRRRVARWLWLAAPAAAVLALAVLAGVQTSRESDQVGGESHRFARVFDVESRTARYRLSLWQAVLEMMDSPEPLQIDSRVADPNHPVRWLVGYGPETLRLSLNRFLPRELVRLERRGSAPDRAHNVALDRLAETGVIGLIAWLWLCGTVLLWCIRSLVPPLDRRMRCVYWLVVGSSVPLAVGATVAATGSWLWSGLAAPIGLVAASFGFAAHALWKSPGSADHDRKPSLRAQVSAVIIASMIAHLVESSFSMTTISTHLYFWFFAAAAAASIRERAATPDPSPKHPEGTTLGLLTAVICSTLVFCFACAGLPGWAAPSAGGWWRLPVLVWIAAMVLVATSGAGRWPKSHRRILTIAGVSLLPVVVVATGLRWSLKHVLAGPPVAVAESVSLLGIGYSLSLLFTASAIGALIALQNRGSEPGRRLGAVTVIPFIVIAAVAASIPRIDRTLRADVYAKYARAALESDSPADAVALAARAIELAPFEDAYHSLQARSAAATAVRDDVSALDALARAEQSQTRAVEIRPLDPDHIANLARLRVRLSKGQNSADRRSWYERQAVAGFKRALRLRPGSAEFLAGLGGLMLDRGELDAAAATLEEAVRRDDRYTPAVLALARCHMALADEAAEAGSANLGIDHQQQARRILERALQSAPDSESLRTALAALP